MGKVEPEVGDFEVQSLCCGSPSFERGISFNSLLIEDTFRQTQASCESDDPVGNKVTEPQTLTGHFAAYPRAIDTSLSSL
jgi:hypothetical protein